MSFFSDPEHKTGVKYIATNIRHLDAGTKLFLIIILTILVFLTDKIVTTICLLISFTFIRLTAKIPFKSKLFFLNLTLLAAVIILMQMLFAPGDSYIIKPLLPDSFPVFGGAGSLKWEGFFLGITIVCRLAALLILLPVFTETTEPHRISACLCSFGVNYRISFIITAAFNFISYFREEALVIMEAQKLRGMRKFGIKAYTELIIPLMLSAMRKAQYSSIAMDCRAFGIHKKRTWIDKSAVKKTDIFVIIGCVIFTACLLFLNYYLN